MNLRKDGKGIENRGGDRSIRNKAGEVEINNQKIEYTNRQLEVLQKIADGHSTSEIASHYGWKGNSGSTRVRKVIHEMTNKVESATDERPKRSGLIALFIRLGIIKI